MKRSLLLVVISATIGCGGSSSPTAPSPSPTPTPTPTTFTLSGTVTSTTGAAISGATVRIEDGPDAGKSATTNASGNYSLASLRQAGFTVRASATNYHPDSKGVTLTSNLTLGFQLAPTPLFTRAGSGANVFDMPTTVSRVRIQASYTGRCENFVVYIATRLIVNEILGTCFDSRPTYDGTHLTSGGVVEVKFASGINWTFTEVR